MSGRADMRTPLEELRGPWSMMAGCPWNVLDQAGVRVARCDFDGDDKHPEVARNAASIAVLPEALAVVVRLLDETGWSECGCNNTDASCLLCDARAVIEKAKLRLPEDGPSVCLCGHVRAFHKRVGGELKGSCADCTCELFEVRI